MANVLADASATADCKGRSLNVGATDLTPGTPHNINYSPSEGCGGNSSWTGSWSSTPTYVCTTPSVTATELVSIVVTPANGSIVKGAAQQFTATGTFSDNSTQNVTSSVTWSSTDTAVATINSTGLASGVAAGHTSIQPTSGSASGSPRLNVTLPAVGGIDSNATTNGACNAPASSCTTHATSAPARKETIMIIAWWAGQSLTATASDRGVNFYIPIVGPTNVPSTLIKAEVWYAVNRGAPTELHRNSQRQFHVRGLRRNFHTGHLNDRTESPQSTRHRDNTNKNWNWSNPQCHVWNACCRKRNDLGNLPMPIPRNGLDCRLRMDERIWTRSGIPIHIPEHKQRSGCDP